ncbi:hypothetical protein CORC01_11123 [Colletotrichum orchidophilum]|uniref:Uncharacterized protein n=1 Tax=Colletotrichum orchidophilum TaxID=1209926 RepID=A0A1G4AWV9_9PEZI|nr:uncharacterized protein CORC01_11123 [Colletotrichum orchidophilum]OHE93624.1 hypothetical protein CORC01_11123 [Colletotrichum orchidophilum]
MAPASPSAAVPVLGNAHAGVKSPPPVVGALKFGLCAKDFHACALATEGRIEEEAAAAAGRDDDFRLRLAEDDITLAMGRHEPGARELGDDSGRDDLVA